MNAMARWPPMAGLPTPALFGAIALALLSLWLCGTAAADAQRPIPDASYRYLPPWASTPQNPVRQQEAYSYRNGLAAERLRMERSPLRPAEGAAARLRAQGAVNRELGRVDQLLNR